MVKKEPEKFMVILLGIIFNPEKKKILIGRRENDPLVPELTWVFPGGNAIYKEELEITLKKKIKEQTGLGIENLGSIFSSRVPKEKKDFLLIYHLCEVIGGREKAGGAIKELKWVSPEELEKHFTTSFHPHLKEYIMNLK